MEIRAAQVFLLCVVRALRYKHTRHLDPAIAAEIIPIARGRRGAYPRQPWIFDRQEAKRLEARLNFWPDNIRPRD